MARSKIENFENKVLDHPHEVSAAVLPYLSRQLEHLEQLDHKGVKSKYINPVVNSILRADTVLHESNSARGIPDRTTVLP